MYLTRVALDSAKRDTQRALSSPHIIHGSVEQGFDNKKARRLWRLDWLHDKCYLLVFSEAKPDFTHIAEQFGDSSRDPLWETKNYDTLLSRLEVGQNWHFRLCANPVRSSFKDGSENRGQVYAHVTTGQQKSWLLARSNRYGFILQDTGFEVVHTQWYKFAKGIRGNQVTLRKATFEGRLVISNAELFNQALITGIGRGKAYGCGLLTIAGLI